MTFHSLFNVINGDITNTLAKGLKLLIWCLYRYFNASFS